MPDARATTSHPGAAATSWPGRLVDRALSALSADYRRPAGPIVIAGLLHDLLRLGSFTGLDEQLSEQAFVL